MLTYSDVTVYTQQRYSIQKKCTIITIKIQTLMICKNTPTLTIIQGRQ